MTISLLLARMPRLIVRTLDFIGVISLEIYLCHMLVLKHYASFVNNTFQTYLAKYMMGIIFIIGAIVCGWILNKLITYVSSYPKKLNKQWIRA